MKSGPNRTGLLILVISLVLLPELTAAGASVKSISDGRVTLADAGELTNGTVFEVRSRDDLLGFLRVEKNDKDSRAGLRVTLIAGRATVGAKAIPVRRPTTRIGFLGGAEAERVKKELDVLCPGRVVPLKDAAGLADKTLDAVVITSALPQAAVRAFAERGGLAIVDLATYAAWSGAKPKEVEVKETPNVKVVATSGATRGLGPGQTFSHFGKQGERKICRHLQSVGDGGRVLLALLPNKEPTAVEHVLGKGRLLAVDLLAPNGEPGYDDGSVLKWLLPGNLLERSVRYCRAISERLEYDKHMRLQEDVAKRVEDKWVREKVGVDSGGKTIWRFRMGELDRPIIFFDGAIHAGEWLNPYLLLDFIEYLANVPGDDYKTQWLLRNYTITVIPMLSGSMRQESCSDCDLNRNFDFRWEDYTKGYGWRAGRALKLRGTAPFSEPEARVLRDHIWNCPVIGHVNLHMHGIKHGAMFIAPHEAADSDRSTFDAASHLIDANLFDRFLWKGPSQLIFRRSVFSGRTVPFATNWAAHQGIWAVSTELVGGSDFSIQEKELGIEGLLAFAYAVGVDYAAGKRRWLGCPRTGFARPGGCKDATAMIFTADGKQTIAYRTNRGEGTLELRLAAKGCRLHDELGEPVQWKSDGGRCVVPMGLNRLFFECGDATRAEVLDSLNRSKFTPKP